MPSKIYPNWAFWFENKPSGNPHQNELSSQDSSYQSHAFANDFGRILRGGRANQLQQLPAGSLGELDLAVQGSNPGQFRRQGLRRQLAELFQQKPI
jgi:hypothetical protein